MDPISFNVLSDVMMLVRFAIGFALVGALAAMPDAATAAAPDDHAAAPAVEDHGAGAAAHGDSAHGDSGHAQPDLNPLTWQTDLAIWTAVIFLVLLGVLWKFAWGPIMEGLAKRENGIAATISDAEKANEEAKRLLAEYEQKLADSKDEVRQMLAAARQNAEKAAGAIVDKAKQDAVAERDRSLQQIEVATAGALKELAEKGADLAVDLAGKIVGAKLDPGDHKKLIDRAVANFADSPPSNN